MPSGMLCTAIASATVTSARGSSMAPALAIAIPSGRLWRKMPAIISSEVRSNSPPAPAAPRGSIPSSAAMVSTPMASPAAVPARPHLARLSGSSSRKEIASIAPPAKASIPPVSRRPGGKATPNPEPITGPATATASTQSSSDTRQPPFRV